MLNYQDPLDATFQALADTTRRTLLVQLARGPASVTDLARPLAMSLPAVMQHLAVLEQAGLVQSEKVGRVRTCRMVPSSLSQAEQWISQRRAEWEGKGGHLDRLDAYLATMKKEATPDDNGN